MTMKWLLIIAAVLVCLILIVYVVGLALPVRHTASVTGTIHAPAGEVWTRITDVTAFSSWRSSLKSVEVVSGTEWIETSVGNNLPMKVVEKKPVEKLVIRINTRDLPFGGEWIYELKPAGDSTMVIITENGEVYNPLFRFISRFIMGHKHTLTTYLSDLERSFR